MQTMHYDFGNWLACAAVDAINGGKLLAVISVTNRNDANSVSKHTAVFDHQQDRHPRDETEQVVRQLLRARYGG